MSRRPSVDSTFAEIAELIASAKVRAAQAVNTALIDLYWQVGGIISRKIAAAEWGEGVVDQLATYLARAHPGLRGFTRRNLFRMRQFHDAWTDHELVPAARAQLPSEAGEAKRGPIVPPALAQLPPTSRPSEKVAALLRQLPWTHHLHHPRSVQAPGGAGILPPARHPRALEQP